MIENIFAPVIIFLLLHYSFFLAKIYYGLKNFSNAEEAKILDEYVSIIVPFRNEADNIERTYNNLINQNYPSDKYEIIFVNDSSEDDSFKILQSLSTKENVKIFSVPDDFSANAHKKRAVRFGIEKSKGEIIVTTDADCIHKPDWLINLLKYFDEQTGLVSGPVEFLPQENLFVKIQRLEFAGLVITGAGLIGASNPIICNAANIAYRKIVFNEVGGFNYQMSLSSGDDELLMQKIKRDTSYKIKFAADKNVMVSTKANQSIKQFFNQRKRWASKGLFYNDKFLIVKLVFIYLFYLFLFIQPLLALFISKIFFYTFVVSFFVKLVLEYIILKTGTKLLFNSEILKPFFISELFQIPYIIVSAIAGIFGNFEWKGRLIKR